MIWDKQKMICENYGKYEGCKKRCKKGKIIKNLEVCDNCFWKLKQENKEENDKTRM